MFGSESRNSIGFAFCELRFADSLMEYCSVLTYEFAKCGLRIMTESCSTCLFTYAQVHDVDMCTYVQYIAACVHSPDVHMQQAYGDSAAAFRLRSGFQIVFSLRT